MTKLDTFRAALVKWFKLKSPDEIKRLAHNEVTNSLTWSIGRSRFVATLENAPIPKADLQYASNNSLHWPDAEKVMLTHKAHFTVSCISIHRQPWRAALDLTRRDRRTGGNAQTHRHLLGRCLHRAQPGKLPAPGHRAARPTRTDLTLGRHFV